MRLLVLAVALSICLLGCTKYQARPLMPRDLVLAMERERREPAEGLRADASPGFAPAPLSFTRTAELLAAHGPALRQSRAEYQTALALARVKTPLPNPALEAGPQFGFGPDVSSMHRLQPFGSLGFSIPTGKRRKHQDELHRAAAEMARVELQAGYRESYMELRKFYSRLALARSRLAARKAIVDSMERTATLTRRQIEAGQASALELGLTELDLARVKAEILGVEREIVGHAADLSQLVGVHADFFKDLPDPALPEALAESPGYEDLREKMIAQHTQLGRIRARYEMVEHELKLEVSKQYPDFHIGPSFERDVGERKNVLGLTLGIELPLFDRNQQAIATASQRREEIRVKYMASANKALAALDKAWRSYSLAVERMKLFKSTVLPQAEKNTELARKALAAGTLDSLKVLDAERAQRGAVLEALETELAVREAWIEIEAAVGFPLLRFPGEGPVEKLEAPDGKD